MKSIRTHRRARRFSFGCARGPIKISNVPAVSPSGAPLYLAKSLSRENHSLQRLPPRNHSFLAKQNEEREREREEWRQCTTTSLLAAENNLFTKSAVYVRARYRGRKEERKTKPANVYRGSPRRFIDVAVPISSGSWFELWPARVRVQRCLFENDEIAEPRSSLSLSCFSPSRRVIDVNVVDVHVAVRTCTFLK